MLLVFYQRKNRLNQHFFFFIYFREKICFFLAFKDLTIVITPIKNDLPQHSTHKIWDFLFVAWSLVKLRFINYYTLMDVFLSLLWRYWLLLVAAVADVLVAYPKRISKTEKLIFFWIPSNDEQFLYFHLTFLVNSPDYLLVSGKIH